MTDNLSMVTVEESCSAFNHSILNVKFQGPGSVLKTYNVFMLYAKDVMGSILTRL